MIFPELTLKKLSIESNLDIDFLRNNLNKTKNLKPIEKKNNIKKVRENKYELAIKHLIHYMLKDKKVIKKYNNSNVYIPIEKYRILASEIKGFYQNNGSINVADLMNSFVDDNEMINLIGEIASLQLNDQYNDAQIDDYISVIKEYFIDSEKKDLKNKMQVTTDREQKLALAQKMLELKQRQSEKMEELQ